MPHVCQVAVLLASLRTHRHPAFEHRLPPRVECYAEHGMRITDLRRAARVSECMPRLESLQAPVAENQAEKTDSDGLVCDKLDSDECGML